MNETRAVNLDSRLPRRRVVFAWDMHYSCNYRCPYCFYTHSGWTELAKRNDYKTPEQWVEVWKAVHGNYGRCQLRITAGEPFTYPRFPETVSRISEWHDVQTTTNGSNTEAIRRFTELVSPERAELDCTFHPLQGEFEPFVANVRRLRESGFVANVCYLAYPPQMPQMAEFKRKFAEEGIYMNLAIFWGRHEGQSYPFAYTPEEKRLIKDVIGFEVSPETVNLDPIPINGKVCGAGQRYAVVQADGRVYRCGQLCHPEMSIGSLFDPGFRLFEKGQPCQVDYCRCKEYQSAWEEEDAARLNHKGELAPSPREAGRGLG